MSSGASYIHRTFVGSCGSERVKDSQRGFNRELQALKHDLDVEVLNDSKLNESEFHDREDLVHERQWRSANISEFCLVSLNVPPRGGEFLRE